jgi:hypothetical protein
MAHTISRRGFITAAGAAVATRATRSAAAPRPAAPAVFAGASEKPALLGGTPVRGTLFPSWPLIDEREEKALLEVLHSGKWFRLEGRTVDRFEEAYARLTGARHCIATANGTSALFAALAGLGVAPGDEVILPPYTFIATLNVVFLQYALPVFADSDPETLQMDARRLEGALSERTAVIVPVHLGGNACDLDTILVRVKMLGNAACHTGARSCFFNPLDVPAAGEPREIVRRRARATSPRRETTPGQRRRPAVPAAPRTTPRLPGVLRRRRRTQPPPPRPSSRSPAMPLSPAPATC